MTNPAKPMGWGEINNALSIAQSMITAGTATDLQSALLGTTTTSTTGGTTTTTQGILQMRASGMGWGQIANKEGVKLGNVVSAGHRSDRAPTSPSGNSNRPERTDMPTRPDHPDHSVRPERPQLPERPAHPGHG
ncbi:MAG: hypothetical protein JF567_10360 [Xanthomonadales bacterium]|nr:hypothetical protein [Xanthomonadales bacterium]